jgi:hypothetical protein
MDKLKVAAYCVMETPSEPIRPTNLETIKTGAGLFYISFKSSLQSLNRRNRNGRNYDGDSLWRSMQAEHIQELIAKKSWCGEAGHPLTEDVKRILTIDPKLTSHRIYNLERRGDIIYSSVDTLASGYGIDMSKRILQEMEVAFSLRALAQIQRTGGEQYVRGKSHLVCYDWVILPSHKEAYQDTNSQMKVFTESVGDLGNSIVTSGKTVAIMENQIIDYIKVESVNVKKISSVFEVAQENMTLTSDLKYIIMKEQNDTYYVKVEDKIKKDISSYLSKL